MGTHWKRLVGGWRGGGEGGGGLQERPGNTSKTLARATRVGGGGGGGEGGGGLGTHWKPLNTSKTLARAARKYFSKALATATGSVGGWHGGGDSAGCGGGGGGGEGGGGLGTHWKPLNTSKTLARAGGVGGGGVEAVVRAVGAWGR